MPTEICHVAIRRTNIILGTHQRHVAILMLLLNVLVNFIWHTKHKKSLVLNQIKWKIPKKEQLASCLDQTIWHHFQVFCRRMEVSLHILQTSWESRLTFGACLDLRSRTYCFKVGTAENRLPSFCLVWSSSRTGSYLILNQIYS